MIHSLNRVRGFQILATDGAIGSVDDLYFDDEHWAVRYLVVDTGTWLSGRRVLISPISIAQASWSDRTLSLRITREQVQNSPDIDTHQPVSRQHEATYARYYGYPYYWGSSALWGPALYPSALAEPQIAALEAHLDAERERAEVQGDDHLRRSTEVTGYQVQAGDREIGHVSDFLLDDETWALRYFVVNTSRWWFGHKVLLAPSWISTISWQDRRVVVDVTREAIKSAPSFDEVAPLDRQWEGGYHAHFNREPYWSNPAAVERGSRAPFGSVRS